MLRQIVVAIAVAVATASVQKREDALDRAQVSNDEEWLERLLTVDGAAESETPPYHTPKQLRQIAYLRLGQLGTPDARAAIHRVEAAARVWRVVPDRLNLERVSHPSGHFGDPKPEPFAQVTAPNGVTYALIELDRLGGVDAFLMWSSTPQDRTSWSRPVLVPDRFGKGITDPRLTWIGDGDRIRLDFSTPDTPQAPALLRSFQPDVKPLSAGPQSITLSTIALARDEDGDGWTDLEESRLRLNPSKADTDGDGIPDGVDTCPAYAPSPFEADDEEAAILKKVFFAGYGVYGSSSLYIVGAGSRPVQLWGSRAPVLYADRNEWTARWGGQPPRLSWRVTARSKDPGGVNVATVEFGDYVAPMAAAGYTATLRKLDGDWFVVKIVMNWIS